MTRATPILTALTLALTLTACGKGGKPDEAKAAAAKPAAPLLLAPEDLRQVGQSGLIGAPVISGAIQPARRADLRAEVAAVVLQVAKDNGERVRAGDLIIRLDATAIRDSLTSAEEALRASQQSFEQTERVLVRQRTLNQQGMISMQGLEDAEVRRNAAQSELAAAKARLVTARQQVSRTEVRAPFDGVVSERKISVGDTVQVGRELVKVIDPSSMRFEGQVSADRLGELKLGQPVAFRINGFGDAEFRGKLARIDAAANATTRQVELIAEFDDKAKAPQVAGLYAEGRVESADRRALVLAEGSIQRQGDSAFAWKVAGSQLKKVAVTLGERDDRRGEVVVTSGLALGDEVLRAPTGSLVDGATVQRVKPGAGAASAVAAAPAASK
ncbi:efflux RND transporter periplasmic adaptor subunit [Roseateles asaccharophilus]|uniref:RND family efflux transporter MFP subunit n=1 Tax=Roseateles asaccharophilus TaxID=582607 RepID=A0ABU2AB48_9BURK|nr:efflux RND transporter periplasmic adaptor subunit [Roseateles asaccharophilus]MDR7334411.1 RND family efflux transporter MFP subunit [Roseateles asaccharophilus]